ncbi:type II toxin-antitoxin system Phd/YefM family antitoxin [Egibacter rhizosphaerae]|nr:type II toxin-antitoxin system prevent-host-death family antitoxin [Egibacter rhizosphaerae]
MSEVGVAELRRELKRWIERVQAGEEVVITDRGRPVARLIRAGVPSMLERLTAEGHVSRPAQDRLSARELRRIEAQGGVSEYVTSEREARRA